jgi:hypothetical protein
MEFNLDDFKNDFDLNETVLEISLEDVFTVLESEFTEDEQEIIATNFDLELMQRKFEIDWQSEIKDFLKSRFLEWNN